ncbi:hypothetical protein C8R44DRAFT_945403 [Mycena epipterygia]|nr:hypothetical protein C8R44DRAFT_945403 [Mycena epipterygia]
MPQEPTVTDLRVKSITTWLTHTTTLLEKVTDTFGTPFIQAISSTTLSLIAAVQNVKRNKDECIQLVENIQGILYTIIDLHITSDTRSLPPAILNHIGKFTETLHKIHMFVETQQDGNKIKYFFRQNEMNKLRKDCQAGLEEALKVFKVETSLIIAKNMIKIHEKTEKLHQELLELVGNLSDGSISDGSSFIYQTMTSSSNSSNSFSLLPAQPKIFHGRQSELENILKSLGKESAHIAILGAGGIGKTSLARAALHHPDVTGKYEHRFFVAADAATTSIELAAFIGSYLGLKPVKDLTRAVVQFLSRGPPCLLVLDNLETAWEPLQSRGGVEECLSLLTDIPHLALIITMRGTERPANVCWTRPFLEPLKPLPYNAARQTFIEIADDFHDPKDINQLLQLTDNMPLAVNLIAHLVDYEGCTNVLARWKIEKTSLLSTGYDKQSSLDASIIISLESPRMTSGAKDLLSLLSILPDGLSNAELIQSDLPIQDLLGCRATLLQTSLAYSDDKQRLKSLVPIREHIQSLSPPSQPLFHPLCNYFQLVIDLYQKYDGAQLKDTINQITLNLGNLHQLLLLEFHLDNPDLADAIDCTLSLNSFLRLTGHAQTQLMDHIPSILPHLCDHQIEAKYATEILHTVFHYRSVDPQPLIQQGIAHFHHINDPVLEAKFYTAVGYYYQYRQNDLVTSRKSFEKALSVLKYKMGEYSAAIMLAREAQIIAQLSGSVYQEAMALSTEVLSLIALGNLKEGASSCQRARDCLELCGMQGGGADHSIMISLADIHVQKSEYREARKICIELSQKISAQESPYYNAYVLLNIAEVDNMIGADVAQVQQNLDAAKAIFSSLGMPEALNQCDTILADLHLREAQRTDSESVLYCLERLADIGRWTSTTINGSYKWPVIYVAQAHKTQEKLALYTALRFMGDLFLLALEGFTYMNIHRSKANCMVRLGDMAKRKGDLVKAVELWKEAYPLFEQSSQMNDMEQIDARLASVDQDILDTLGKPCTSEQATGTYHNIVSMFGMCGAVTVPGRDFTWCWDMKEQSMVCGKVGLEPPHTKMGCEEGVDGVVSERERKALPTGGIPRGGVEVLCCNLWALALHWPRGWWYKGKS